jgi:hypothetical protein
MAMTGVEKFYDRSGRASRLPWRARVPRPGRTQRRVGCERWRFYRWRGCSVSGRFNAGQDARLHVRLEAGRYEIF